MDLTPTFRWATQADAPFIAWGVCCALHTHPSEALLNYIAKEVCSREADILYSYRNALLAEMDGRPVGLCLCYDGQGYHERRLRTFALFEQAPVNDNEPEEPDMDLEHAEDETQAGEYYIDSLAVLPEYRGRGIARLLMQKQIEHGRTLGLPSTLLVDPSNPPALRLYESLGFQYHSDCYAFGMTYTKMMIQKQSDAASMLNA